MIKSHTRVIATDPQFPTNTNYSASPIFQRSATADGSFGSILIANQGLRDAYNAGQRRIFKDPIEILATNYQKFVPSQDDFKQADKATPDIHEFGARANVRGSTVVAFYPVVHTVGDKFWDHKVSSLDAFGNPIMYPETNWGDLTDVVNIANAEANENFDPLYINIDRALTFNTTLYHIETDPDAVGYHFRRDEPIVRSRFQLGREEPLLDFLGMSVCRPHAVFPTQDFYPPFIQDFHLYTQFKNMIQVANATPDYPSLTMELTPTRQTRLFTRSIDGFDQTQKELQKADTKYPLMERFVATFSPADEVNLTREDSRLAGHSVSFETNSGPPDAVFLKLEREVVPGAVFTINQPRLTHVALELYNQDVQSVSDLGQTMLYHAVRRNSNYRADTVKCIETEGCVLLVASDFGNWARWQNRPRVDNFRGQFIVQFEAYSRDRNIDSSLDRNLEAQKLTLTVVFIYTEYGLVGTAHNNRFRIL